MKNWKLLLWSLGAFALYAIFKYAPLYNKTREVLTNNTDGSPKVMGYYILIKIGGWFLLLFGTIGLGMFFYHLLKPKKD